MWLGENNNVCLSVIVSCNIMSLSILFPLDDSDLQTIAFFIN